MISGVEGKAIDDSGLENTAGKPDVPNSQSPNAYKNGQHSSREVVSDTVITTADQIKAECALRFPSNSEDCNKFVKAVSKNFFEPDLFLGPNMNADAILAEIDGSADWQNLNKSHELAISDAISGRFVIAGMSSTELGDDHGHLAIVVGDPGQVSGAVTVPICYAGSLSAAGRVQRKRVSETFGTRPARDGNIRYYSRATQTVATKEIFDRLIEFLRGVRDGD